MPLRITLVRADPTRKYVHTYIETMLDILTNILENPNLAKQLETQFNTVLNDALIYCDVTTVESDKWEIYFLWQLAHKAIHNEYLTFSFSSDFGTRKGK